MVGISGCGSNSINGVEDEKPLVAPVAKIGESRDIRVGDKITLDGGESNDSDGEIISFQWIENNETLGTGVKLKDYITSVAGIHTILLIVTDDDGLRDSDSVDINVSEKNSPPIANAGEDRHIHIDEKVTLDANNSLDPDGEIVAYEWKEEDEVLSTGVKLKDYASKVSGVHEIKLKVLDNDGASGEDKLYIFVLDNNAPIADAGDDKAMDIGGRVTLSAERSKDSDGEIISYEWREDDRVIGTGVKLIDYTTEIAGIHTIILTVVDDNGLSGSDSVYVNVMGNYAPIAYAGEDKTIRVNETVTLDGSTSQDKDGHIMSYQWREGVEILGTGEKLRNYSSNVVGEHTIILTVQDNNGAISTDSVIVNVVSANIPPIADAGEDKNITVNEKVTLDGRGSSDSDGTIVSYEWREREEILSTGDMLRNYESNVTGVHIIELTVKDNDGATDSDRLYIIVN